LPCGMRSLFLWGGAYLTGVRNSDQTLSGSEPSACPACPVAPGDGTGVGAVHRTGVRDKPDPFRLLNQAAPLRGVR